MTLKYKIEALLFSSGRRMTLEELETFTKATPEDIRETLKELEQEYQQRHSSIHIIDDGNAWKLTVKDEHIESVKQVVTKTELSKTLLETLAVIAFKYPIKQADLIKIRTNKAYDHLSELEELGYITRQKFGRTRLIKLTEKFFEYFDLPEDKLKEKFQDFEGIAKAITDKEQEIDTIKRDQKADAKKAGAEIDLVDASGNVTELEQFDEPENELEKEKQESVQVIEEKVGNLDVVDVPEDEEAQEEEPEGEEGLEYTEEMGEEVVDEVEGMVTGEKPKKSSQEVESDVDAKVDELLKKSTGNQEEETDEEEPEKEEETPEDEQTEDEANDEEDSPEQTEEDVSEEEQEPPKKLEDVEEELQEEIPHAEPKKDPEKLEKEDKKEK